jgi:poly-gamma-glutamate synthesis protein (capsule biosynthesis protein)
MIKTTRRTGDKGKSLFLYPLLPVFITWLIFPLLLGPQPRHPTITLALLGDVMLGRGIAQAHADGDWATAFEDVAPWLQAADLALANLESPLSPLPLGEGLGVRATGYNLCTQANAAQALVTSGLDLLSIANNHTGDCGAQGPNETRSILNDLSITPIGPAITPVYRTVHGLRLAFFALDDVGSQLDLDTATREITLARGEGALVVVSIHWGSEYHAGTNSRQVYIAQALADAGASLVWGHHPHVLQRLEWLTGEGQPHPSLIAYSLGNALFDQVSTPDVQRSALLLVQLDPTGVQQVQVIPLQINPFKGRVTLAGPDAAEKIIRRLGPVASPLPEE